ncbi:hypothetical protein ACHAQJ_008113 [Trichoderma viride]
MSFSRVKRDNSGSDNDETTELIIAVVALITSVLALIISMLQALQQYFASAQGFSSCSEAAIGKWNKFSERRMRWSEFRIEVLFDAPVIFLARPENDKGPLGADKDLKDDQKIVRFSAGVKDLKYTHDPKEFNNERDESHQKVVRTANNEKATWYILLMAVYENGTRVYQLAPECVHWKNFDLNNDNYRAQGNGFLINGKLIDSLGVTFTFQKHGQSHFEAERIIPTYGIKHLCFVSCQPSSTQKIQSTPIK